MNKHVFLAAIAVVWGACLQAPAHATLVVSAVETITGGPAFKTVTINIKGMTVAPRTPGLFPPGIDPSFEQVGYYNFQVNLTGPGAAGISGLTASYNTTSVFSGLTTVDLDGGTPGINPGVTGTQIRFQAGSPTNIGVPTSGDEFIGSISFTTTLNGSIDFSITPLATVIGTGFARNGPGAVLTTLDQEMQPKTLTVSGIQAVPEPTSLLLIGSAIAVVGGFKLRRRTAALKP
jgi:PEP-CTERM motif